MPDLVRLMHIQTGTYYGIWLLNTSLVMSLNTEVHRFGDSADNTPLRLLFFGEVYAL